MIRYVFYIVISMSLSTIFIANHAAAKSAKARYYKQSMTIKGVKRDYFVYLPKSLKKNQKAPAVIAFHGFQADAHGMRWLIKADKWAEKFGMIMIYPNAVNKSWAVGKGFGTTNKKTDDLSFAAALVDVIKARHPINPNQIYAMGYSNGGQMAALMACKLSHKISAAAVVAHTLNIPKCEPKKRIPTAWIHGQKDTLAPFNGGGKYKLTSHADSVKRFSAINDVASKKPKVLLDDPTVHCKSFAAKHYHGEVIDCVAKDAGHTWPGGVVFKTALFGPMNKVLNANELLFQFFKRHPKIAQTRTNIKARHAKKQSNSTLKDTVPLDEVIFSRAFPMQR